MQVDNRGDLLELLILAMIRLTAWKERRCDTKTAWRSYDWAAIDSLQDQGLVFFSRRGKVISLSEEGEILGTAAAEMLGEMLEALKEQAEGDGTSIELPEYITNRYASMLPLSDNDLVTIDAAADERRRYEEMLAEEDEEDEEQ